MNTSGGAGEIVEHYSDAMLRALWRQAVTSDKQYPPEIVRNLIEELVFRRDRDAAQIVMLRAEAAS